MDQQDQLERQLAEGWIDRRAFLQRATALGLSLAALSTGQPARAATPKAGGQLRMGLAGASITDTLAPGTFDDDGMRHVSWAFRNNLTEIDNTGSLIGELAESFDPSADAKTWAFKLRAGVTFHNGKVLDSGDVVASMNLHRGASSKSAAKVLLDQVDDIRADGPGTVIFSLKGGNADWPVILTDYNLPILPAKDGAVDPQDRAGTGCYILEEFNPGVSASFRKNPNSWKPNRGHFDAVAMTMITDVTARSNGLTTGELDVINRADLKTAALLKRRQNLRLVQTTGTQHYTFPMLVDVAPFTDVNIRLALKCAVNRQELVDKILFGYGKVANDHPIAPSNRFFASDLPQRTYDPERAKFHLKQAGLNSLKVQLYASDAAFDGAVDAGLLYQQAAKKAGIDIEVVRAPSDGYWTNVWLKKPWCMSYWAGRPSEDWMFSQAYAADTVYNETHWKNPRFNELLVAARSELDEGKRRAMYHEMQLLCRDDGGAVIPMYANYVWATSDKLAHADSMAANWELDGDRLAERWWFG